MQVSHWRRGSKCERLAIVLAQTCCFLPSMERSCHCELLLLPWSKPVLVVGASPLVWIVFSDTVSPNQTPLHSAASSIRFSVTMAEKVSQTEKQTPKVGLLLSAASPCVSELV